MGRLKSVFVFVACLLAPYFSAQQFEITYEVIYRPMVKDTAKYKTFYILQHDAESRESLFKPAVSENPLNILVYKNLRLNNFSRYESILNNSYMVNYNFDISDWELQSNQKEMMGYMCHEARISLGGREWIAWYTNDLPLQDGPYKFSGLPGLILEIHSRDGDYQFAMKGLKKNTFTVSKPKSTVFNDSEKEKQFKLQVIEDPALQYRNQMLQLKNNNMGVSVSFNGKEITQKDTETRIADDFDKWRRKHDNPIEKGHIWVK